MKSTEVIEKLKLAAGVKTLYIKGCFGAPMTAKNKDRYSKNNPYNRGRAEMINAADEDTFGFDCVCLVKGILWGWCADASQNYGGAKYESNDVPDIGTEKIIKQCADVSEDFSDIVPGELLHMPGHVGVYIGDGLAVECTPAWENGVQITAVGNIGKKDGYRTRTWKRHGKLPWVEYVAEVKPESEKAQTATVSVPVPVIKRGVKCDAVRALQALLNMRDGAELEIDGSCGALTERAIKAYQRGHGLVADGTCGGATWASLIGE